MRADNTCPGPWYGQGACRAPAPRASLWRGNWMWWKSFSQLDARSPSVAEHCINSSSSSRLPPPFHCCLLNTRSLPFSHSGAKAASSFVRRGCQSPCHRGSACSGRGSRATPGHETLSSSSDPHLTSSLLRGQLQKSAFHSFATG